MLNLSATPSAAPPPDRPAAASVLRWLAVLLPVLLLHALAGHWVSHQRHLLEQAAPLKPPLEVLLLKPQTIEQIGSRAPAAKAPAAPPKPATPKRASPAKSVSPVLQALDTASAAQAASTAAAGAAAAASGAAAQPAAATSSASAVAAHAGVRFALPPAADLRYDTFVNGVQNMPGTISWITDGQHYDLVVSIPIPFVGKFTYLSHGHVDAYGLAPERYIEQRGAHAADETRFERDAKRITFTRTPTALALPDGAQDRFSMVFQLASLVRGDPARYTPGVTRSFYVVDNDSGEDWPVETIGLESIRTGETFVSALHFMRLPRHDGDRRKIDVWLAPSLGYFPIRLVQTEPSGTQIELLLHDAPHRLEALSDPSYGSAASAASSALSTSQTDQTSPAGTSLTPASAQAASAVGASGTSAAGP